jgi:hypothetical protein
MRAIPDEDSTSQVQEIAMKFDSLKHQTAYVHGGAIFPVNLRDDCPEQLQMPNIERSSSRKALSARRLGGLVRPT